MRARFTALAWGKIAFIMATTHVDCLDHRADRDAWWAELAQAILGRRYDSLVVLAAAADGEVGEVTFAASALEAGVRVVHRERSQFVRQGGRWLYRGGTLQEALAEGPPTARPPAASRQRDDALGVRPER